LKKRENIKNIKKTYRSKNRLKSIIKDFENKKKDRDLDYPEFPQNYEVMKYMNPARNQDDCGSCYAIAALSGLEARLKLKNNMNETLSVTHVLACSVYNQGCDGGYAYLAFKFGHEVELVPESCMPYKAVTGKCSERCDISKLNYTYKVHNYKYIGGSYGKCNERLIMKELYENGPFPLSFEPLYPFMMYKSGIFRSLKGESWMKQGITKKPEWQKVDHSVVVVGWGYDEEKKQNIGYYKTLGEQIGVKMVFLE